MPDAKLVLEFMGGPTWPARTLFMTTPRYSSGRASCPVPQWLREVDLRWCVSEEDFELLNRVGHSLGAVTLWKS